MAAAVSAWTAGKIALLPGRFLEHDDSIGVRSLDLVFNAPRIRSFGELLHVNHDDDRLESSLYSRWEHKLL